MPDPIVPVVAVDPSATESDKTVDPGEYRKLAESYENMNSAYHRRDKEVEELRKKVKQFEESAVAPTKPAETTDEEDDDQVLLARLQKLGLSPKSNEDIRKEVEMEIRLRDRSIELRNDVKKSVDEMPFVKEQDLLAFLQENPRMSVDKAVKALYFDELKNFTPDPKKGLAETDTDKRTIIVRPNLNNDNDAPVRKGIAHGGNVADYISKKFGEAAEKIAGAN